MSRISWLLLFLVYVLYLLIGGFAFQAFECNDPPINTTHNDTRESHRTYYAYFYNKMNRVFKEENNMTDVDCDRWSLYNSVFFSFTAMTTIGFGHLAPETWQGKLFCIFYSLLGVPINGILIGSLAGFFGSKLQTFKKNRPQGIESIRSVLLLSVQVIGYLIPGFIVFMVVPAVIFWHIEDGWSYLDSLYFAFVTLMTIGFGDYVAGRDVKVLQRLGNWKIVYETGLIIWILFGLGYIFMIITIITESIKTPARKAVKKIAEAEKIMVTKILRELIIKKSKPDSDFDSRRGSIFGHNFSEGVGVVGDVPDFFSLPIEEGWSTHQTLGDFHHHHNQRNEPSTNKQKSLLGDTMNRSQDESKMADQLAVQIDYSRSVEADSDVDETLNESLDELNHDTITSLHNFIKTAKLVQRSLHTLPNSGAASNYQSEADISSRPSTSASITSTPELNRSTFSKFRHTFKPRTRSEKLHRRPDSGSVTPDAALNAWGKFRRGISHSGDFLAQGSATLGGRNLGHHQSLAEVLRTTTLEEFLQALEKVQADDEQRMVESSNSRSESRTPQSVTHRKNLSASDIQKPNHQKNI